MDASKKCVMILLTIAAVYSHSVGARQLIEESKETKLTISNPETNSVTTVTTNGVGAQLDASTGSSSYGVGSSNANTASGPGGSTGNTDGYGLGSSYGYAQASGPGATVYSSTGAYGSSTSNAASGPGGSNAGTSSYGGSSSYNYASSP